MTSERSAHPLQPSWRVGLWLAIFAALLVPLLAMLITHEIAWTASDFRSPKMLLNARETGARYMVWSLWETSDVALLPGCS